MLEKNSIVGMLKVRVGIEEVVHLVAGGTYQRLVIDDVSHFQVEHTALLKTLQVARTPQPQVGLGNDKAVGCAAHGLDALLAAVAQFVFGHEDTVGLITPASHTPP